jgi:hypothetical protein
MRRPCVAGPSLFLQLGVGQPRPGVATSLATSVERQRRRLRWPSLSLPLLVLSNSNASRMADPDQRRSRRRTSAVTVTRTSASVSSDSRSVRTASRFSRVGGSRSLASSSTSGSRVLAASRVSSCVEAIAISPGLWAGAHALRRGRSPARMVSATGAVAFNEPQQPRPRRTALRPTPPCDRSRVARRGYRHSSEALRIEPSARCRACNGPHPRRCRAMSAHGRTASGSRPRGSPSSLWQRCRPRRRQTALRGAAGPLTRISRARPLDRAYQGSRPRSASSPRRSGSFWIFVADSGHSVTIRTCRGTLKRAMRSLQ